MTIWKLSGFLILNISFSILVIGCMSVTDSSSLLAMGESRHVPLVIYDTSWNDPHTTAERASDQDILPSMFYVEFMNTHPQVIAKIWMHVFHCGAKGAMLYDGWLRLDGPFLQNERYKVTPQLPEGTTRNGFMPFELRNHMVITEIKVLDADGTMRDYQSDVSTVLGPVVSNFCAVYP